MAITTERAIRLFFVFLMFNSLAVAAPVAIWNFDECNGTIANDATGNGNTGTFQNGVTWTNNSHTGCAAQFDGINDLVFVPDAPSLDITQNINISTWVYPRSYGYGGPWYGGQILTKWGSDQRSYAFHFDDQGHLLFRVSPDGQEHGIPGSGTVISNAQVPLNQWTHISGVYDGSFIKVYINERLDNSAAYNQGIYSGTNDLAIGSAVNGNQAWFNGIIDNVIITGDNVSSIPPNPPSLPFLITFDNCPNGNNGGCAGFRPLSGTWTVQSQTYTTHPPIATYLSAVDGVTCSDCTIETKIKISSSDVGYRQGITFRGNGTRNYYVFDISNEYDIVEFVRYSLADDPTYGRNIGYLYARIDPDQWYTLKVRISGDTFTGYLNGSEVLRVSDPTFTEGTMGLYAHRTDVVFDDFSAQRNVVINITDIGGSSISPLLQRQGNPLAVQFAFQPNALYFNATTLPPETVVGELTLSVPFLVNQPYYLRYYIEPREFNTPLKYAFENFGFMPRMLFATLHFNEITSFYVMADQNAMAIVPVVKASLGVPYYIQALVYNGNEFVLSDGYKVIIS